MDRIVGYVVMTGAIFLGIARSFQTSIWGDEAYTVQLVQMGWKEMIASTAADVHPPLYYAIVKVFWELGFQSIPGFKIVSFIPVILLLFIGGRWIERYISSGAFAFFGICVGFLPGSYYNTEIRMYSWLLFFSLFQALCLWDAVRTKKRKAWIVSSIWALAASYTHYFGVIVAAAEYLGWLCAVLAREKGQVKNWAYSVGICVLGYFPWLAVVFRQLQMSMKETSVASVSLRASLMDMANTYLGTADLKKAVILFAFLAVSVIFGWMSVRKGQIDWDAKWFVWIGLFGFAFAFSAGLLMNRFSHFFSARYLYPSVGILYVALALMLSEIRKKWKRIGKSVALFLFLLFGAYGIRYSGSLYRAERIETERTEETLAYLEAHLQNEDIFLTDEGLFRWTMLSYYCPGYSSYDLKEEWEKENPHRIWLLLRSTEPENIDGLETGYQVEEKGTYQLDAYQFRLYSAVLE